MLLEEEQRLDPVAALDCLGADAFRELAVLLRPPELRVVAVEHRRDAALVPVHGQEDVQRPPGAFDVAVERRPERVFLVLRDERVDDYDGVLELRVHRCDVGAPVLGVIPLGMRAGPAPQAWAELLHFHPENLTALGSPHAGPGRYDSPAARTGAA